MAWSGARAWTRFRFRRRMFARRGWRGATRRTAAAARRTGGPGGEVAEAARQTTIPGWATACRPAKHRCPPSSAIPVEAGLHFGGNHPCLAEVGSDGAVLAASRAARARFGAAVCRTSMNFEYRFRIVFRYSSVPKSCDRFCRRHGTAWSCRRVSLANRAAVRNHMLALAEPAGPRPHHDGPHDFCAAH